MKLDFYPLSKKKEYKLLYNDNLKLFSNVEYPK